MIFTPQAQEWFCLVSASSSLWHTHACSMAWQLPLERTGVRPTTGSIYNLVPTNTIFTQDVHGCTVEGAGSTMCIFQAHSHEMFCQHYGNIQHHLQRWDNPGPVPDAAGDSISKSEILWDVHHANKSCNRSRSQLLVDVGTKASWIRMHQEHSNSYNSSNI